MAIDQARKNQLYSSLMREELRGADSFNFIRPLLAAENGTGENEHLLLADFQTYLPSNQLHYADRMSMAASIESRVPFLDHVLVEYVATLPSRWKLSGLTTKRLLRAAARDLLPSSILDRPKMGFPVPLSVWFREEHVRDFLHATLLSSQARQRGLWQSDRVEQLVASEHGYGLATQNRPVSGHSDTHGSATG